MDPIVLAVVMAVTGALARLVYKVVKTRGEVRRAEVAQRGLSERVRFLPPGSRLSERSADREVEISIGISGRSSGER